MLQHKKNTRFSKDTIYVSNLRLQYQKGQLVHWKTRIPNFILMTITRATSELLLLNENAEGFQSRIK